MDPKGRTGVKPILVSIADVSEMLEQDRKQGTEHPGSGEVEVRALSITQWVGQAGCWWGKAMTRHLRLLEGRRLASDGCGAVRP